MIKLSHLIVALAILTPAAGHAQDASGDADVIVVQGLKDPALVHYRQMLGALRAFSQANKSPRVHMVLRVVPKGDGDAAGPIHVVLKGDDGYVRELKSYIGGRVDVPEDDQAVTANADFVIHAKPGTIKSRINVVVDVSAGLSGYGQMMDDMRSANDAERAMMSPAQRRQFPDSNALAVHFATPGGAITVKSGVKGEITLKANRKGVAVIPYDAAVYAENPQVVVSGNADFAMVTSVSSKWKSH